MTDMVRLRNGFGTDECNCRGHAYHVSRFGTFVVPVEDLLNFLGPLTE
jgi:hypothetical protein